RPLRGLAEGDLAAFTRDVEEQGRLLAHRGAREEHARLALAFELEGRLHRLLGPAPGLAETAVAVARLVTAGQLALASGYARARESGDHGLEPEQRRRLARDLHDEFGSLAILKCSLEQTAATLRQGRTRQARRRLEETAALVTDTIESVRRV